MRFLYLDKLKTDKEYNFQTIEINIDWSDKPLKEISADVKEKIAAQIVDGELETFYDIHINVPNTENVDDDLFFYIVNVVNAMFVDSMIIKGKGRKREHRLDVPNKIKEDVCLSFSLLKSLVNTSTHQDHFTYHITCEDFNFDLINQDYEKTSNIFVPEKEEITDGKE